MARPLLKPEHLRINVGITLAPALVKRVRKFADAAGKPLSHIVEQALTEFLSPKK